MKKQILIYLFKKAIEKKRQELEDCHWESQMNKSNDDFNHEYLAIRTFDCQKELETMRESLKLITPNPSNK